jgi:glycosyltransferase involved in cell wall biosynthesis
MMKISFYAPMKPPDHPTPSGDREIARALMRALALAGHEVTLASRLRTFDRDGDARVQHGHRAQGERDARGLAARYASAGRPDVWFTYHLHHKAPDCVGPHVAHAVSIPYVVAEASLAPRQATGTWSVGYALARDAIRDADAIVHLNPADIAEVRRVRGDARDLWLGPFVDVAAYARERVRQRDEVRLVTVAMMRQRAKLASYRMLGRALAALADLAFSLVVVGDGPARADVEAALAPLGDRVEWRGALPRTAVIATLRDADLFVWPAVDEAIGMAFVEAQAAGLPVVAGRSPGVAAIVDDGRSGLLTPLDDAAFADAVRRVIVDAALRARMAHAASARAFAHHDIVGAAAKLDALLRDVVSAARREARPSRPAPSPALP